MPTKQIVTVVVPGARPDVTEEYDPTTGQRWTLDAAQAAVRQARTFGIYAEIFVTTTH